MSKSKYQKIIEEYCSNEQVDIPMGFYRHSAGHLGIIKTIDSNRKLVAMTWFKVADVIHYLNCYRDSECQIYDFKQGVELTWNGGKMLPIKGSL